MAGLMDLILQKVSAPAPSLSDAGIDQEVNARTSNFDTYSPTPAAPPAQGNLADGIIRALAGAVSVGTSQNPAAALERQLVEQRAAAERERSRQDRERLIVDERKFTIAGKKAQAKEDVKKELRQDKQVIEAYNREIAGQKELKNFDFEHSVALKNLGNAQAMENNAQEQEYRKALIDYNRGDARKAEGELKFHSMLYAGIDHKAARETVNRIYNSAVHGEPTKEDAARIKKAHDYEMAEKERLAGRGESLSIARENKEAQLLSNFFLAGFREYNDVNQPKTDLFGKLTGPLPNQDDARAAGIEAMLLGEKFLKAKFGNDPSAFTKEKLTVKTTNKETAPLNIEDANKKINEMGQKDPLAGAKSTAVALMETVQSPEERLALASKMLASPTLQSQPEIVKKAFASWIAQELQTRNSAK